MAFVEVSKQGHVGIVTMNRPETLNALSSAVFADLLKAFGVVLSSPALAVPSSPALTSARWLP